MTPILTVVLGFTLGYGIPMLVFLLIKTKLVRLSKAAAFRRG